MYAIRSYYGFALHPDPVGDRILRYRHPAATEQPGPLHLFLDGCGALGREGFRGGRTGFLNRITSYNVCYTKLLRQAFYRISDEGDRARDAGAHLRRPVPPLVPRERRAREHEARGDEQQDNPCQPRQFPRGLVCAVDDRITSYNVCYTKLLRPCSSRAASMSALSLR